MKPCKRVRCFDAGPEYADRYTVLWLERQESRGLFYWLYVGMSAYPYHPQGVGQHGETKTLQGFAPGKQIPFSKLPAGCQKLVTQESATW